MQQHTRLIQAIQVLPRPLRVALLVLALLVAAPAPASLHADADNSSATSGVVVVLWPTPSVQVRAGDVLVYTFQAKNFRRNGLSTMRVFMPYNPEHITILDAQTERPDDWLSELGTEHITITFGEIPGGESYHVRVTARVNPDLPDGTVLNAWLGYSWVTPGGTSGPYGGNAAPVVVGATTQDSPNVWMLTYPDQGPVGSEFGFFSDRFVPGEEVAATLAYPDGRHVEYARNRVNSNGQVWFAVQDGSLPPGNYALLLRGLLSNLHGSSGFVITADP